MTALELSERLARRLSDASQLQRRQAARSRFSPSLSYGRHFGPPAPSARQAAVMIVLEPVDSTEDQQWSIPLTLRPDHLPDHPGQISLPGGRLEAGETHQQAAEREFCEELGLADFPARVLGGLQPLYVYNSDYFVQPFVAMASRPLTYRPCAQEVARVIRLPLAALLDPARRGTARFQRGRASWTAATIDIEGVSVWGATAIILGELAELLDSEATLPG